jgi:hypothetical protein
MFDMRLIRAEVLKLRKRRGMLAISALATIGVTVLAYSVMAIQHSSDPAKHGPAGGLDNYQGYTSILMLLVIVVGAIVGSTAGSQDIETGVFRDSAATGRSRVALFGARIPGALAIVLPLTAVAAGLGAFASVAFASGSVAAPASSALVAGIAGALAAGVLSTTLSVGLSALVGSRGPVIGIVLAFELAISKMLMGLPALGGGRALLPNSGLDRISQAPTQVVSMSLVIALAVVLAWSLAAFAAGAWKTATREI